jgi:tetratricopeptide (TPR) repeat protein
MICPYCLEDVPAKSQSHNGCRIVKGKQFPPFYIEFHAEPNADDPIVFSVVGSVGHGKTVFLCALFDFLDNHLGFMWPKFFNHVLDQESLTRLNENRKKLADGELPPPTQQSFPRPGIFRLTKMPHSTASQGLAPLVDTTLLIYDPPGEAFRTDDKIREYASFVRRSSCVLFLIDLIALGDSIPDKMSELLDTYLLGMGKMGVRRKSQHLIVVYTKSDNAKVSVPEFHSFLENHLKLRDYLNEQRPQTLSDPQVHLDQMNQVSRWLETFTRSELKAVKFINEAADWFASVSFTAVSSLGSAPEEGEAGMRLPVKMSPRCVADPLLYVLAKSVKPKVVVPPAATGCTGAILAGLAAVVVIISLAIYFLVFYDADFKRAYACEQEKDYVSAIENYSKAIEASPEYAAAYVGRGWSYLKQGNYGKAIEDCDKGINLKVDFAEALTCRGTAYSLIQNYQSAFPDCNKAIELKPEYAEPYICRGIAYSLQRQYEQAIKDCDHAIELKPDYPSAYLTRGNIHVQSGKNEPAIKDYNKAIELVPNYVEAYEMRGSVYASIGNFVQSLKDFDEAIRLQPKDGSAYSRRGDANVLKGDHNQAIQDYTRAIQVQPDYTEAYFKRGDTFRSDGKNNEAITDYDSALTLRPGYARALYNRGLAYYQKGDYGQAIKDYEAAIRIEGRLQSELNTSYSDAFYKRGVDFYSKGENAVDRDRDYSLAVADFTAAIRLNPNSFNSYFKRGSVYFAQQEYDEAINDYTKAIEIDPKSALAYNNRGEAYEKKNDISSASADYSQAIGLDPYLAVARKNLENCSCRY